MGLDNSISSQSLDRLGEILGVESGYWDISGTWHQATNQGRQAIIHALGYAAGESKEAELCYHSIRNAQIRRAIRPVHVISAGDGLHSFLINLPQTSPALPEKWCLKLEDGTESYQTIEPDHCSITGTHTIGNECWHQLSVQVRTLIPEGYHQICFYWADSREISSQIIATPEHCFLPGEISEGQKFWGIGLQLYSLRSQSNWGIGDFGDLIRLAPLFGKAGASFIGLNPLHALPVADAQSFSPYSPVSRLASNFLYLDIERLEDFQESTDAQAWRLSPLTTERLKRLREDHLVDYPGVSRLKIEALKLCYENFRLRHLANSQDLRHQQFEDFMTERGSDLWNYALYQALQEYFATTNPEMWGWPVWPADFKTPESSGSRAFFEEHKARVLFFIYLEWLVENQLEAVKEALFSHGIGLGLYQDMALGSSVNSSDIWGHQDMFSLNASIGAPPDAINEFGQNWGLPVPLPRQMEEDGYGLFRRTLRTAMRHAGMLRLDHVMSLLRLFWIPQGADGRQGVYVRYPLKDLMGIVALESKRNNCVLIGEDLGTVPDEVRTEMFQRKVLSYKLFIFEKNHLGAYKLPTEYQPAALVAATTHDLPTIYGYWTGEDIKLRRDLKLYPNEEIYLSEMHNRSKDREQILRSLEMVGIRINKNALNLEAIKEPSIEQTLMASLISGLSSYLAQCPCYFQVIQMEDLVRQREQVNMPGTTTEHPNWRRKISIEVEKLSAESLLSEIAAKIKAKR